MGLAWQILAAPQGSSPACVKMNINRILGQDSMVVGYLVYPKPFGKSECCGALH